MIVLAMDQYQLTDVKTDGQPGREADRHGQKWTQNQLTWAINARATQQFFPLSETWFWLDRFCFDFFTIDV